MEGNNKEWKLIEKLLGQAQAEQRKSRRWGIFFKSLGFIYLFSLLFLFSANRPGDSLAVAEPHVAMVDLNGAIMADSPASADLISTGLREAFEAENAQAVLLRINSPGGSPVQSNFVYNEIRRLRAEHPDKKLYAAITDMGASGAYYIASAADEIYADPASIVGSIGVIMANFGLQEAADKLGVERRVYTAGENKDLLDPFAPVKDKDREHVQTMLDEIHQQFIGAVKQGRGDRLKVDGHPELFSGLFWTGQRALELGLVDGLKSPGQVARDVVGVERTVDYTVSASPLDKVMKKFGVSIGDGLGQALGLESGAPTIR
ncbi:signal peptide peptidase SppA [Alloalcanivorax profundimaris]|uniref:signal peptide peptidase SppA n=1 Tax=Alloalcanivorax profundimaris TaxID=2735259 RepID=UPI001888909E|nr:signal peptide peptidase SppA [Alloalcanivorax profundimaris]MBF1800505.1 signal peptide peptidase SppA [Alloalcanivorax profundimaris]MCQ6262359.1 signal peptide peptidase SppA [Alcanivorax sp. MM125-6]